MRHGHRLFEGPGARGGSRLELRPEHARFEIRPPDQRLDRTAPKALDLARREPFGAHDLLHQRGGEDIAPGIEGKELLALQHREPVVERGTGDPGERADELKIEGDVADAGRAQHGSRRRIELDQPRDDGAAHEIGHDDRKRALERGLRRRPLEGVLAQHRQVPEAPEHRDGEKRIASGLECEPAGQAAPLALRRAPRRHRRHQLAKVFPGERREPEHGSGDSAADLPLELDQLRGRPLARGGGEQKHDRRGPQLLQRSAERPERGAVTPIGLVQAERERRLVGDGAEQGGESAGHLAPVTRRLRLDSLRELRDQCRQHGERAGIRGRESGGSGQAATHEAAERAPRCILVAAEGSRSDGEGAVEREALQTLVEQSGLTRPRVTGDEERAGTMEQSLGDRPLDFGRGRRAADQRRLVARGRFLALLPAMSPDPLSQRLELPARPFADLLQPSRELVMALESRGRIPGQCGGADLEAHGWLRVRLERRRAPRRFPRGGEAARGQRTVTVGDEGGGADRPQACPFGVGPVLEPGCALDREPLEEVPPQHGNGLRRARRGQALESSHVHVQVRRTEGDGLALRLEPGGAQARAQAVERFVERVAGLRFVLLGPECAENLISRSGTGRGEGQIDQEREMLAPEHVGRGGAPPHARGSGAQADELEVGQLGRRAGILAGVGHGSRQFGWSLVVGAGGRAQASPPALALEIWHSGARPAMPGTRAPSPFPVPARIVVISGSPEPGPVTDLLDRLHSALAERYAVVRELGRGGTAIVFLARDLRAGRLAALKVLRPEVASAVGTERFLREIRVTSRLQHPHLLPLFDSGEADGCLYYSMPYVAGESLRARLWREGQLPIEEAVRIAGEVAEALAYAHSQGVVHRDIKPENILLETEPEARALVADFGIAHALTVAGGNELTATGVAIGTPAYMSPEQGSHGRIDPRSDVYALACVLYEMLAGSTPFTGPTAQSVLARHAVDPVPSLRTVRPTVSASLERAIVKGLAKVPADRYPDANEFKEALARVGALEQTETTPRSSPRGRRVVGSLVGGGAAIAVVAVVAWRLAHPGPGTLDSNRIMVYPLVVPADVQSLRTLGEDVATMIGSALDGAGPLRWVDGWPLLDASRRQDIRALPATVARSLAAAKRCAYYITGRVITRGDSAEVFLELYDVRGDSTRARGKATGRAGDAWRLGLQAVNGVLPSLIPGGTPDIAAEWKDRSPAAIASFLLGEASFRRVHLAEALAHYRDAVKADSLFGLAALRGAQAASWNHRSSEAASLIEVATRQPLPPRYAHFARGYQAWLEGRADSAGAEFRRALALDPEMSVAWMQLGEVYTHLLPERGNPDSLAEQAFEEAHRLDPQATNLLLHLIEIRLRKGEVDKAAPLVRQFLAAEPDSLLAAQVRTMDACVRRGPARVAWQAEARAHPLSILWAANALKGAGAQLPCARQAFAAVLASDTATDERGESRRWAALVGLHGILLAQGERAQAVVHIDSAIARAGVGSSLYLLDAPLVPELRDRAAAVAQQDRTRFGPDYLKCPFPVRLWELAVWEAHEGRANVAVGIARELDARAAKDGAPRDRLLARAVAGHAALASADTAQASNLFGGLMGAPVAVADLEWDEATPMGSERLQLAQLLLARGQYRQAIDIADVFDSAWPLTYILYLPGSLKVRADAAAALGDVDLASRYRARLAALGSRRAVVSR